MSARDDLILVALPREHWESVTAAMDWELPGLSSDERDRLLRAHSERCFKAVHAIRAALGERPVPRRAMTLGEQTRQYQATLEAARRTRSHWGEILSGDDQINEAKEQVATANDHLWVAWANHRLRGTP